MTKKRHYIQRWFCPPKCDHNRTAKILNHWLNETVFGFRGFGLFEFRGLGIQVVVDSPLTEDV